MSEQCLEAKLAEVMSECSYVQKRGYNSHHKYYYATAEDVFKKVNAGCSKRGIALSSEACVLQYGTRTTARGDLDQYAVVSLKLTFRDGVSSELSVTGLGEGSDRGDKAVLKANTAALKYALQAAFLVSWGDDPEQDVTTDEAAEPAAEPKVDKATPKKRRTKADKQAQETAQSDKYLELGGRVESADPQGPEADWSVIKKAIIMARKEELITDRQYADLAARVKAKRKEG